jgi:hypothetical protein
MDATQYAKDVTAENLRDFLELWPLFASESDEVHQIVMEDKDWFFNKNSEPFSWCHFYELPIKQHIFVALAVNTQNVDGFIQDEDIVGWFNQVIKTPGQIGALPSVINQIDNHFDEAQPTKEAA